MIRPCIRRPPCTEYCEAEYDLSPADQSSVRAKVEHVFAVVKLQLRFRKTRYRGLQKKIAKMNIMLCLS